MSASRLSPTRSLQLTVLALGALMMILYVEYMTPVERITPTVPTVRAPKPRTVSNAPPKRPSAINRTQPNLTSVALTKQIYESGHVDPDPQNCPNSGQGVKLLIAITSAPAHIIARMAIRDTWGHFISRPDIAIVFILGSTSDSYVNKRIQKEQDFYGDIVRGHFVESYDNMTLKMISLLEWVGTYCAKSDFVLKTDDDMFINVEKMLEFVGKHKPEERAIYGHVEKYWKPIRHKESKYYTSLQQYKPEIFPDFTTGPVYLFPSRLSKEMYAAALNNAYIKLEDVFLTGIVADGLKIKRVDAPECYNRRFFLTTCMVQTHIIIHSATGIEQYDIWKKLHDKVTVCDNND